MAKKKPTSESWPDRLRTLRERHGLTQAQAAERIGVSARTWIAWENSQNVPGRLALRLLHAEFPELF